jgi:hypothetical protein
LKSNTQKPWLLTLTEEHRLKVFENRVLRRIFGSKRDDMTGEWRKLHNDELNDLYSSPIIFRVIKSRRPKWAGHVTRMGERRGVYKVLVGNLKEGDRLEKVDVNKRITLRWIFMKWDVGAWNGSIWLMIGTVGGYL